GQGPGHGEKGARARTRPRPGDVLRRVARGQRRGPQRWPGHGRRVHRPPARLSSRRLIPGALPVQWNRALLQVGRIPVGPARTGGCKPNLRNCSGPPPRRKFVSNLSARRSHRPAYPRGGVLAQVCGHQVDDAGRFAHRLRRSLRGQSWAEKSLKYGRILVGFQNLRKPQDAKGTCFPRNSPSRLLEWGSGGRWFESSRPDIRKASRDNKFRLAFFASWGLV